jgi:hypothetical protein
VSDIFELRSVADGSTLRFTRTGGGSEASLLVAAVGHGFDITVPAHTFMCPSLPDFLDEVSKSSATGSITPWATLEEEVRLEVTRDPLGHIFVLYKLRSPDIGSDQWWSFEGRLVLELGAMPALRDRARDFWRAAA